MRKTKEQKAITLIALIITIVVLLILAVVAINAVTGDGIIQHATNARSEYEKAQDEEKGMISYYQEYLDAQGDLGPWKQDGSKIYMTNSKDKVIELKIGDIVNYKNESNQNYLDKDGNTIVWKVLGVESGRILLLSENIVDEYTVAVGTMYRTGEDDLNRMCSVYKNNTVADTARSITIEDVNKVTRYNPETMPNGTADIGTYGNEVTYTAHVDENGECTRISFTATKSNDGNVMYNEEYAKLLVYVENNEWKTLTEGNITLKSLGYKYNGNEIMKQTYNNSNIIESEEYKLIFGATSSLNYGLASKVIYATSTVNGAGYSNIFYFGMRRVDAGNISRGGSAGGNTTAIAMGVRPAIKLKKSVELVKSAISNGITTWDIN